MAKHPGETTITDRSRPHRKTQLRRASDRLAAVLQSIDLETEEGLADEVVAAIEATDRAYEIETGDETPAGNFDGFVFSNASSDGTPPQR